MSEQELVAYLDYLQQFEWARKREGSA